MYLLRLWFGFRTPVSRWAYLFTGFWLVAVKFAGDRFFIERFTDERWSAVGYMSPRLLRALLDSGNTEVLLVAAWTLPFLWIGASMTFRRTVDAGLAPVLGALFFLPVVNYFFMLLLCMLPGRTEREEEDSPEGGEEYREFGVTRTSHDDVLGGIAGFCIGTALIWIGIAINGYGLSLFVGSPFLAGVVTGWTMNRRVLHSAAHTAVVVQCAILAGMFAFLFFAIEGIICLGMAYPLIGISAWVGGLLGREIARLSATRMAHFGLMIVAVPALYGVESSSEPPPLREVVSSVEVNAPASVVWENVVSFPELAPPDEFMFRLGVACPERAIIVGEGVGAIRYCEFSTGSFVEPITVWEPPVRLAFDVVEQPPSMTELSPYDSVFPAHLLDGVVSDHGEFRIVELGEGRVRLEGLTAYRVNFEPQWYWGWWSDRIIHGIHSRVLEHIRELSEGAGGAHDSLVR